MKVPDRTTNHPEPDSKNKESGLPIMKKLQGQAPEVNPARLEDEDYKDYKNRVRKQTEMTDRYLEGKKIWISCRVIKFDMFGMKKIPIQGTYMVGNNAKKRLNKVRRVNVKKI